MSTPNREGIFRDRAATAAATHRLAALGEVRGGLIAAALVAVAGCAAAPQLDLAGAVQPSDIARIMCLQSRPGDEAACRGVQLPDAASALAYGTCLEYHRLDVKACKDLRAAYESELREFLARREAAAAAPEPAAGGPPPTAQRARQLYGTAAALYKATSTDAQTFTAALVIPDVRRKIDAALRQHLSDDQLRALAAQSRSEALYWYAYMQGLERASNLY